VTQMLGPRYRRSRHRVDIDITWDCNLKCFHCNRSCQQAPTREMMTVGQVRHFLEETRQRSVHWKIIHLAGGEPTLHPDFQNIVQMILEFRNRFSPDTRMIITSNGFGKQVNYMLARIPANVIIRNTQKTGPNQHNFVPFNLAPCESSEYALADFRNACSLVRDCGIGLTPYGYYPCAASGAIDRIFGFDCGRKTLPDPGDGMEMDLARLCSLCGFFRSNYTSEVCDGSLMSETWRRAYASWYEKKPVLRRYPEL
jgi:hypothetical protein